MIVCLDFNIDLLQRSAESPRGMSSVIYEFYNDVLFTVTLKINCINRMALPWALEIVSFD